jgi:pyruvate kinase
VGSVSRVIGVLERLSQEACASTDSAAGPSLEAVSLKDHAAALFGHEPKGRATRVMVTMPGEAAGDYALVERLLAAGMNCQRINCAHDGPAQWAAMAEHARNASRALGKPCQVVMDLPGPKLRTGPLLPSAAVLKARPLRSETGVVLEPARLYLSVAPCNSAVSIRLPAELLGGCKVGDVFKFRDARGAKRRLEVVECRARGCWVVLHKTAYLTANLKLKRKQVNGRKASGRILEVPSAAGAIRLEEGNTLVLTRGVEPGSPATVNKAGKVTAPARIGCTSPAVFDTARPGDPVWFDDGKIGGVVVSGTPTTLDIRIHHAPGGAKLRADKGINLPATALGLTAMGEDDIDALTFAAQHADIVELSFVNSVQDVEQLFEHLDRLNAGHLGVVLKIETRQGFEQLPQLLLAAMRSPRLGVMIARGDLAVETGFERTAELQEEMLCLCEAAHVPVIWATQVLASQAKTGAPTRAEITDAAMGARAECVMLNKGPYIHKAVATLDDLLRRMPGHHEKKRDMMRKLGVAEPAIHAVPHGSATAPVSLARKGDGKG